MIHVLKWFDQVAQIRARFILPSLSNDINEGFLYDMIVHTIASRLIVACSAPRPGSLTALANHLLVTEPFAPWNVPLVKGEDLANFDVLPRVVALLLASDREPSLVVRHVPNTDLTNDAVAADDFK